MKVIKKRYLFLGYTILFAILCAIVFYPFYKNHLSLVWGLTGQDGISQHLSSLIYFGEYIRNFFNNLIHGHPNLPMWDNSIGFGSDIFTTLNYYAIGDPLNLIYVFSNKYNAEYLYNFMLIFRAYLAGISFIILGCYFKKNPNGILLGSFIYVFSGVFLNYAIRHPFFLNPMIYLPLLIMGVEKIYRRERPYLFTIMITISAMSNFYFFYMLTIAIVIYALIRFPIYKESGFFKTLFRFSGWYILGLGLSMILLLPVLIGFMGNARSSSSMNYFEIFFYQPAYYKSVFIHTIGYSPVARATSLNFVALAYCAIIALFFKKSKDRFVFKISFVIAMLCIMIPILGYIFHGFSYPMNRWSFVLALIVGMIVTEVYEDLFNLTLWQKLGILVGILLYYIVYKSFYTYWDTNKIAMLMLILTFIILVMINHIPLFSKYYFRHFLLYSIVFISIAVSGFGHYSPKVSNVLKKFVPSGTAYKLLCDQETSILNSAKIKNDHLTRVESINQKIPNWGVVDHIPNTTNYYSITDKNISDSLQDLGLNQYQYKFKFRKLDIRENLLNLYHVKYIITNTESHKKIPSSYQLIKTNSQSKLYENKNILPFGYSYDSYISKNDFKKLNSAQQEILMTKAAVIEDPTENSIQNLNIQKYVSDGSSVTKDICKNYHYSKKDNKKKSVFINIPKKYFTEHCYLYLQDVRSIPHDKGQKHLLYEGKNNNRFNVTIAGHKVTLYNAEKNSVYDCGKRDYLIKIDSSNIKKEMSDFISLKFKFSRPNDYTFGKISIIQINKQTDTLNKLRTSPHLTNISYDGSNHFSGDITTKNNRILCIPFAYSKGWKATDNGKTVKVLKINNMFCGLQLKKGSHKIRLTYTTPGLKVGSCITFMSLIVLLALSFRAKKLSVYDTK